MRFVLRFETAASSPVHSRSSPKGDVPSAAAKLELRGLDHARGVAGFEVYDDLAWPAYRGPTIGVWVPAQIVANTSSSLSVETFSLLPQPTQIRYAHRDTPCPPHARLVYNIAGLPLAPFQTAIEPGPAARSTREL